MADDATEAPSARRLERAREEGDVPVSRELATLAALAAGLLALATLPPEAAAHWFAGLLAAPLPAAQTAPIVFRALASTAGPVAAAAALGAATATLAQTAVLLRPAALAPDLARLSPLRGLKRLFGPDSAIQAARALAKLALFAALLAALWPGLRPVLANAGRLPPTALAPVLIGELRRIVLWLLAVQAAVAAADVVWVRWRHHHRLRMTRQQVRDEHRDAEGNPQVRQRLRQLARSRARRRMMAAVPKATLVVTNPTHYAAALAYERGSAGAPRLVAKGMDEMARRIRDLAREHRVPVVANPPLARALYRVEIDTEIPVEHFRAVAELVAYVWRLRDRRSRL